MDIKPISPPSKENIMQKNKNKVLALLLVMSVFSSFYLSFQHMPPMEEKIVKTNENPEDSQNVLMPDFMVISKFFDFLKTLNRL